MKSLQLEDNWEQVREKLKEANTSLTDEDLVLRPGGEAQMINHLSEKLHKSHDEVIAWIESVSSNSSQAS